ncbi:MAG: ribosome assembly RNA-binding protein YhbY [Solobacterium sp.]|nr:ribosome assembly RNA-binding protein YhbY [Solobacterium sp.]
MLTGKQKRYLRSLASSETALFQIGKEALSDNLIHMVDQAFNTHELIKLRVLKTCPVDVKELAFDLSMNTGSEIAQIIGHTIVLYRQADEPRIILP